MATFDYFSQLTNQVYFGKYPCPIIIPQLEQLGITLVVNLTVPEEIHPQRLPEYFISGAYLLKVPITDLNIAPDDIAITLVKYIDQAIAQGHKVYIHCRGGHGRCGTIAALWYKYHYKCSGEEALQVIHQAHQRRRIIRGRLRKIGSPQRKVQKDQVRRITFNSDSAI